MRHHSTTKNGVHLNNSCCCFHQIVYPHQNSFVSVSGWPNNTKPLRYRGRGGGAISFLYIIHQGQQYTSSETNNNQPPGGCSIVSVEIPLPSKDKEWQKLDRAIFATFQHSSFFGLMCVVVASAVVICVQMQPWWVLDVDYRRCDFSNNSIISSIFFFTRTNDMVNTMHPASWVSLLTDGVAVVSCLVLFANILLCSLTWVSMIPIYYI